MSIPTDPLTGELIWRDRAKVTNLNGTLCDEIKISNGLAIVLTRMVRYQYSQRYQSAKEVLQALSAFVVTNEPQTKKILIGTANPSVKVIKSQRQSAETAAGLLLGGLFILGIATVFYITSLLNKPAQTPIVINSIPNIKSNPTVTTTPTPTPETTTVSTISQGLEIQVGQQLTKNGVLKSNQVISYGFTAKEKQKLTTTVSGEGVLMTILAPNGEPVDTRAIAVNNWDGTLAVTGDYKIQIKSNNTTTDTTATTTSESKPEAKYALSVFLNEDIPRVIEIVPPQ